MGRTVDTSSLLGACSSAPPTPNGTASPASPPGGRSLLPPVAGAVDARARLRRVADSAAAAVDEKLKAAEAGGGARGTAARLIRKASAAGRRASLASADAHRPTFHVMPARVLSCAL